MRGMCNEWIAHVVVTWKARGLGGDWRDGETRTTNGGRFRAENGRDR
jgi:hypothetical protein